jgi:hypothetical protein
MANSNSARRSCAIGSNPPKESPPRRLAGAGGRLPIPAVAVARCGERNAAPAEALDVRGACPRLGAPAAERGGSDAMPQNERRPSPFNSSPPNRGRGYRPRNHHQCCVIRITTARIQREARGEALTETHVHGAGVAGRAPWLEQLGGPNSDRDERKCSGAV